MILPSSDTTKIACHVDGTGPALLLVHGSGGSSGQFEPLRPPLSGHFTLAAMDRRGHGASGDTAPYAIAREAEDIATCLAAIGPADLLAHSYGALCALVAARRGAAIRRLILYEPPINTRAGRYFPPALIPEVRAALDAGDPDRVMTAFAITVRGASPEQAAHMARMPGWAERRAHVPILVRELEAVAAFRLRKADFRRAGLPVLLLTGADSPPQYRATAQALLRVLPDARIEMLPGQQHGAIEAAPALVADAVRRFLG